MHYFLKNHGMNVKNLHFSITLYALNRDNGTTKMPCCLSIFVAWNSGRLWFGTSIPLHFCIATDGNLQIFGWCVRSGTSAFHTVVPCCKITFLATQHLCHYLWLNCVYGPRVDTCFFWQFLKYQI